MEHRKSASFLALILIIAGLLIMYFWPAPLRYSQESVARAKIEDSGTWVEVEGVVKEANEKKNGETIVVCREEACISAYFEGQFGLYWLEGRLVKVRGEVSDVGGNKFLSGHEFEIVD